MNKHIPFLVGCLVSFGSIFLIFRQDITGYLLLCIVLLTLLFRGKTKEWVGVVFGSGLFFALLLLGKMFAPDIIQRVLGV